MRKLIFFCSLFFSGFMHAQDSVYHFNLPIKNGYYFNKQNPSMDYIKYSPGIIIQSSNNSSDSVYSLTDGSILFQKQNVDYEFALVKDRGFVYAYIGVVPFKFVDEQPIKKGMCIGLLKSKSEPLNLVIYQGPDALKVNETLEIVKRENNN